MITALLKEVYNAGHRAGWNECELVLKEQAWQKEREETEARHEEELMEYFKIGRDVNISVDLALGEDETIYIDDLEGINEDNPCADDNTTCTDNEEELTEDRV